MLTLFAERGGDPDRQGKADPLDALMWRAERAGEPAWPSPFGPGRPGWHIECAAIALSRIGTGLDVQGGGSDLVFPHHEFSAAHAESVTGERRFARHYVHAGMIGWDGHKMSKSRGNLVLVSRLRADGVDPGAIRLGLFAGHYRSDRSWSPAVLDEVGVAADARDDAGEGRGHRFEERVAHPLGHTGQNEHVGRAEVVGRVRHGAHELDAVGQAQRRGPLRQRLAVAPGADQDQVRGRPARDLGPGVQQHRQVLLRVQTPREDDPGTRRQLLVDEAQAGVEDVQIDAAA